MDTGPQCLCGRCNVLQDLFRLDELSFLDNHSMDISLFESYSSRAIFRFTRILLLTLKSVPS